MDRLEPLPYDPEALRRRQEALKLLLPGFQRVPTGFETVDPDPVAVSITGRFRSEIDKLLQGGSLEESEKIFENSLEQLMNGVVLDRGDSKKWPALTPEDRAVRVLTNYLNTNPNRWNLEKPFREFNTARHWSIALNQLQKGNVRKAEEELNWAQQELRHVIAIALGLDLIQFREDAETVSQTSGRPEREVTLELFDQKLGDDREPFRRVAREISSLLERSPIFEKIIRPIPESPFPNKEIAGLKSEEEIVRELQKQTENLTLALAPGAKIDFIRLLRDLLHLPEAKAHTYFRMPDIDRLRNVKILDSEKRTQVEFDDQARLTRTPSVQELEGGGAKEGNIFDVAVLGGGPGGIAAGVGLTCLNVFRTIIFERTEPNSTVRDIWSREKEADTFYSGPPDPIEGVVGMQDTTRAVFLNRMNSFIDYFHLNLRTREPVNDLHYENGLWILKTPKETYQARNVIMTAGRYGKPKLLKWEEGLPYAELQSKIVRGVEVDDIQSSTVLVIGGGNTAFDNVRTLTDHGGGGKKNIVFVSYFKKPFNVPGSLHAHNNEQLLQWETEGKVTILWNTNTIAVEPVIENGKKRWKMTFKEEQPPLVCDYFAPAVGWQIDKDMMEKVGVKFPEGGKGPDCDPNTLQAFGVDSKGERKLIPGLYITGDYYLQRSVPAAFTTNFRAAVAIAESLKSSSPPAPTR
jgi:thioredoxin reductase (NADPH)